MSTPVLVGMLIGFQRWARVFGSSRAHGFVPAAAAACFIIAGCGRTGRPDRLSSDTAAPGIAETPPAISPDSLWRNFGLHLDSLLSADPVTRRRALETHEARSTHVLMAMGGDMRAMAMRPDSSWKALGDSIGNDLVDLHTVPASQRDGWLRGHVGRMRRLVEMHRRMTAGR